MRKSSSKNLSITTFYVRSRHIAPLLWMACHTMIFPTWNCQMALLLLITVYSWATPLKWKNGGSKILSSDSCINRHLHIYYIYILFLIYLYVYCNHVYTVYIYIYISFLLHPFLDVCFLLSSTFPSVQNKGTRSRRSSSVTSWHGSLGRNHGKPKALWFKGLWKPIAFP